MKCFADTGKGCSALIKKQCDNCSFYKTIAQVEKEQEQVERRLKAVGRFVGKKISIFN